MNTARETKARGASSGGARRFLADGLTTPILPENIGAVNNWPRAMSEARQRALDLAQRGQYVEAAYWLDTVFYPWKRLRDQNGGAR